MTRSIALYLIVSSGVVAANDNYIAMYGKYFFVLGRTDYPDWMINTTYRTFTLCKRGRMLLHTRKVSCHTRPGIEPISWAHIWPNQYIGLTYQDEVSFLKTWITARLAWIDSNLPGDCTTKVITGIEPVAEMPALYPNPTTSSFKIAFKKLPAQGSVIAVYNSMGEFIGQDEVTVQQDLIWNSDTKTIRIPSPGFYFVVVRSANEVIFRSKLIKL